jgi:hypothetical protein
MVQMFLLTPEVVANTGTERDSNERADDDGFRSAREAKFTDDPQ